MMSPNSPLAWTTYESPAKNRPNFSSVSSVISVSVTRQTRTVAESLPASGASDARGALIFAKSMASWGSALATPSLLTEAKSKGLCGFQEAKRDWNSGGSVCWRTTVAETHAGLSSWDCTYCCDMGRAAFLSAGDAPEPTQANTELPASTMKTPSASSMSRSSLPSSSSTGVTSRLASSPCVARNSFTLAELPGPSSGPPASAGCTSASDPPSAAQNSACSSSLASAMTMRSGAPPRELSMRCITSMALPFSWRLASAPAQKKIFMPRSRTNTSPWLRDDAESSAWCVRTQRRPLM
mmetsp:Transcript_8377/g.33049  ORF Transcript_8377/g.33049 Transcript_8377/m.33049 type:complete len:296 (+) Transcript_8377:1683-2570(+)